MDLKYDKISNFLTKKFNFFIEMNIVETVLEDTKYFINLRHLDLSENEINMEDLVYFQNLVDLKLCSNKIEEVKFHEDTNFLNL